MPDSITLQYKGKKGDVTKYNTVIVSDQNMTEKGKEVRQKTTVELVMSQTIIDVDKDENLTINILIESGKIIREGNSIPLPNVGQTIKMKMTKNGDVLETTSPTDFSQPSFPPEPKKIKDKWTSISEIKVQDRPEPLKLNYRYILWDIVQKEGFECAEIKVSCPETETELQPGVTQTISATGSTYFAHKDGVLVKSEVETQTLIKVPSEEIEVKTGVKVLVDIIK